MYDNSIFTEWEAMRRRDLLIDGMKQAHTVHDLEEAPSHRGVRATVAAALVRLAHAIDRNAGAPSAAAR